MYIKTDPDKGETRPSCGIFGMWKMFPSGWNPLTFPIWWIFCENNADWRRVGQCGGWWRIVTRDVRRRARPGPAWDLLPEIRCSVIRVSSAVSSDGSHRGPGHQATLVNTTLLTVLARPGGSVLLGTPDSNIRESQRAASCVSSLSDLGPHQWPGDWFNDIPLHTSIHYHWTSPPRTPHIAWWIYHIH